MESERSDESLMEGYALGSEGDFELLFRRYEARAFQFFLRRTRCRTRASDLYQELFLRIHRARQSYDVSRPFAPWFFQIARRLLIDDLRRSAARACEVPGLRESLVSDVERAPDREIVHRASARDVLEQLSPVERFVLLSNKVDGQTYSEIARELGKSVVAVKKLASRALQRLRAHPHAAAPSAA